LALNSKGRAYIEGLWEQISADNIWSRGLGVAKVKRKVVPVLFLAQYHAMKAYWASGGTTPSILDLGTRWR
jgi:hypothetical protein